MQASPQTHRPMAGTPVGSDPMPPTDHRHAAAARLLLMLGILALAGVLLLHLGLLPRGGWGADEYRTFGLFRDHGWSFLWFRFWSWSPRPLSEALIALYALAVTATGRPLLVPTLGVVWLAALLTLWSALAGTRKRTRAYRLLGALAVLCAVILGHDVARVFYWPFGAVAYAPVVIVALALLFRYAAGTAASTNVGTAGMGTGTDTSTGTNEGGAWVTAGLLIAAAWASEAGALLVVVHVGVMVLWLRLRGRRVGLAWGLPFLAALVVLAALALGQRTTDPMLAGGDPARYHHLLASLMAAAQRIGPEFLSIDAQRFDGPHLLVGAVAKLAFFLGIQGCWMTRDPVVRAGRARLPLLALSLVLACFAFLTASYRQFGLTCCEQHAFLRQALGIVALAAVAIWTAPRADVGRGWRGLVTPVALVLAIGLMLAPRARVLWRDYVNYLEPAIARGLTWQSGRSAGDTMTLYQPPSDAMFPNFFPDRPSCAEDWWAESIRFFFPGKTCIRVVTGADRVGADRPGAGQP